MISQLPKRYVLAAAAVTLLMTTLLPGTSMAANEATKLDRARKEIAAIRKRVEAAKNDAGAISTQVQALDSQIGSLNRQIRTGRHDISVLESNIRQAELDIADLEGAYASAVDASNERAARLYKAGPASLVSQLLSARSLGEFVRMNNLWQVAAESDGSVMIRSSRLKNDLIEEREDLLRFRSSLADQKAWLEQRRNLLADARNEQAIALATVEGRIANDEAHIAGLEKEARELTAVLRRTLSRSTGAISRAGFIWPVPSHKINQGYRRRHPGIDIDGDRGQPIVAVKAGTVVASCSGGYGICSIIDHGGGVSTLYAHMSRKLVSGGQVSQGQVIGFVGCTGRCTGDHLHFETRVNGEPRNPFEFLP